MAAKGIVTPAGDETRSGSVAPAIEPGAEGIRPNSPAKAPAMTDTPTLIVTADQSDYELLAHFLVHCVTGSDWQVDDKAAIQAFARHRLASEQAAAQAERERQAKEIARLHSLAKANNDYARLLVAEKRGLWDALEATVGRVEYASDMFHNSQQWHEEDAPDGTGTLWEWVHAPARAALTPDPADKGDGA